MLLDVSKTNHVCTITLNRPEKRNAITREMFDLIQTTFTKLSSDTDIFLIVVRGTSYQGKKFFSAGIDFVELAMTNQSASVPEIEMYAKNLQDSFTAIEKCTKPVIAVLEGFCLGAGLELALACDLRLASCDCKIGFPETELAIIPDLGGTTRATRVVGTGKAKELIMLADEYTGEQAFNFGLVNFVCPSQDIENKLNEIIGKLLKRGPLALGKAKKVVDTVYPMDISSALDVERFAQLNLLPSKDVQEGFMARMEKREPKFQNK